MATIGTLDKKSIKNIKENFEKTCVDLLMYACIKLKKEKSINADWDEENISANIYMYIRNSQLAIDSNIYIENEHYVYSNDVLDNKIKAKKAPRIDFVFQHNWSGERKCYFVEAKKVLSSDYEKKDCKTKILSTRLQNRYIKTGIDNFITSRYPKGCLLGYVLNGTIETVVEAINILLNKQNRCNEILHFIYNDDIWAHCKSNHNILGIQNSIDHFMFNFN